MLKKNLEKHLGEVYALHTIYGDCLMQIAGCNYREYFICRVFSNKYSKLPSNLDKIIQGEHDFVVQMGYIQSLTKPPKALLPPDYSKELKLRGVTDNRKSCATLIGKFDVPNGFVSPNYCKYTKLKMDCSKEQLERFPQLRYATFDCGYIPRNWMKPWPLLENWMIHFGNSVESYGELSVYEWVTKHLKMNFDSDKWHQQFVDLGPGIITDATIIMMLEDDFSLNMWLPSNFKWENKKYFEPTKEWRQLKEEELRRESEKQKMYELRSKRMEELKAQGIEFKFWETQIYKDFIKLVKG